MDSINRRILAGEIVLIKDGTGYAIAALTKHVYGTEILTIAPIFGQRVVATKKTGEAVAVLTHTLLGRSLVEGQEVVKVSVSIVAPLRIKTPNRPVDGFCRCDGEADTHGRCYQCGGYQRDADAGRHM